jgi:restriction system protein
MPVPKYDEMMLPMLEILADGAEHPQRELANEIANHFKLTPAERAERLPKVKATYLRHPLGWAGFSLRRAGLAESPRTGTLQITDEGRKFLSKRAKLSDVDPFRFEQLVLDLLLAMGYGGSRAEAGWGTKRTGDEGIDGVINEDRLGLSQVHIQAKNWKGTVGLCHPPTGDTF